MKTLTLDYSKWRCGGYSMGIGNALGRGITKLLNKQGYMCCLGQFASQLKEGLTEKDLLNASAPSELQFGQNSKEIVPYLTERRFSGLVNTVFSNSAISINDDSGTTIEQKISQLRKLLKENELKLRVINKPKIKNKK